MLFRYLMMIHCVYLLCLASVAAAVTYIDDSDDNEGMRMFELKKSSFACPIAVVGEQCPDETPLYYYRCCGDLNNSCCFRLQEWVIVMFVIVGVLIVASLFVNFIRFLFCAR
ncbi:unnamed protein product [Litomosoides sigmodontis]|uniref:Uncharacterized protein n=1 Tax=Litomosoides sigmodontis TaxID=42156 RepID=A0A3P6SRM9_LITSI|nr:unnamed protein product [Litomosoides sigmodontis]